MEDLLFKNESPTPEQTAAQAEAPAAENPPPAKKDGRGRPRKNPAEPAAQKTDSSSGDDEAALKAKLSDFKKADEPTAPEGGEQPPQAAKLPPIIISGAVFLSMIDFVCPRLIMFIYSFIDERTKNVDVADLKLTKQQITDLEPVAGEVSKIVFAEINPLVAFGMMLGVSYFANMEEALVNADTRAAKIAEIKSKQDELKEL